MSKKLLTPVVSVMIGSSEITAAIHATQAAKGLTTQIKSPDIHGAKGERTPAINPITVTGATAGAAKTLATMLIGEICPEMATMTGVQKIVAANGVAITIAKARGIFFENFSTSTGANNKSPAVAKTESAKPGSRTCQGSAIITAPIAKPSAGSESLPRWVPCANNKTDAIAAARSTDGDGRTNAMKAIRKSAVTANRNGIRRIRNCIRYKMKVETIAKLAPLTATKWVRPDLRISSLKP